MLAISHTIWSYTSANVSRRSISAPYRFSATGTGILGYSLSEPVSAYGIFSLKAGLTSDSGFHCSPYRDLKT
jgi:hypothetical protein